MDFNFTEEQSMLRDTVASFLQDKYDFEKRRKMIGTDACRDPAIWEAFANELGILGAPFSEELGGLGGGAIENMIVMEEFGKALVVEPYLGTVVIGGGFLKHSGYAGAADLIGGVIEGKTIFAFAYAEPQARYTWQDLKTTAKKDGAGYVINDHKAVVVGAPWATPLIGVEGKGLPLVNKVIDEATAASCAEAVGAMRQLHAGTLDYAKQRKQFGTAIANFQVLQHRMVDMFMNLEQSVSMTYMATIKLSEDDAERAKAVSAAKVQIGKACKFVGQNAIQIHGGMGMTDELAIGHYFKRATMIEGLFGSVDHHLRRYETLSFDKAA